MNKILITGGSGLLGSNIAKLGTSKFDVYATYNKNKVWMNDVHFFQINLTKKEQFVKIEQIKPDFIIHCAALTNVDYCESHPNVAYDQNVLASVNIAEAAQEMGAYLMHISTDSVFDGTKGDYKEDDMPNPVNVYGKTKWEAEQKVSSIHPGSCIVRTNIYGWNIQEKFSLAEWVFYNLKKGNKINGFMDVYFTPVVVNNLADALLELYERDKRGVYNIAGSERVSKYEFGVELAKIFELNENLINPISVETFNFIAKRPKDTSLNVSKAKKELKTRLLNAGDGLKRFKSLLDEGCVSELKEGLR
jgi:dTDP-4-dehydrorhamnose reductase